MSRSVLIVDDDAECVALLELAFEDCGIDTLAVATAEAALAVLQHQLVAAIVTDLHLPQMSGIELMERVHVPVVIVSAAADSGVGANALRAGAAAFFAKPYSPAAVCAEVGRLLEGGKE
jgi:CheY-like chemotaxis protein